MTGCISHSWKGIRVHGDSNSFFSLGGAERSRSKSRATIASGLLEDFCLLGRTGRQPPAHREFLEDTASVDGDQGTMSLSVTSSKSAHMGMWRCRG